MKGKNVEANECSKVRSERAHFQYGLPYIWNTEIPGRDKGLKREYNRRRQALLREKRQNKRAIATCAETFGFYGFYKSSTIHFDCNAHIWDPCSYNRDYYQEAFKVIFGGYVPSIWEIRLLVVVGVSIKDPKSALPSIAYVTRTIRERQESLLRDMGEDYLQDDGGLS